MQLAHAEAGVDQYADHIAEVIMHVQVVNFNLEGSSRAEYETVCNELAEAFAALPGLVSKHWLADEKNNTYGTR